MNGMNSHAAQDGHAILHERIEANFAAKYERQVRELDAKYRAEIEAPLLARIAELEREAKCNFDLYQDCGRELFAAGEEGDLMLYRIAELEDHLKRHIQACVDKDKETAHWKNNHETEVRRARVLKERPDLPIERVDAYEQWGRDQRIMAQQSSIIGEQNSYIRFLRAELKCLNRSK